MKDAPIPLCLDLWALGHSQNDIATKLGFPNRKHVARIIAHAREIGDPRAVYHVAGGRIVGKGIPSNKRWVRHNQQNYAGFLLVERIGKVTCLRGHPRTPESVYSNGRCIRCQQEDRA